VHLLGVDEEPILEKPSDIAGLAPRARARRRRDAIGAQRPGALDARQERASRGGQPARLPRRALFRDGQERGPEVAMDVGDLPADQARREDVGVVDEPFEDAEDAASLRVLS